MVNAGTSPPQRLHREDFSEPAAFTVRSVLAALCATWLIADYSALQMEAAFVFFVVFASLREMGLTPGRTGNYRFEIGNFKNPAVKAEGNCKFEMGNFKGEYSYHI